jgi:hypothetical protein
MGGVKGGKTGGISIFIRRLMDYNGRMQGEQNVL